MYSQPSFYNDRILFLEKMIEKFPDNKELLQSYTKLIEKQWDWEIKNLEHQAKIHHDNTEFNIKKYGNDMDYQKNHDNNMQKGYPAVQPPNQFSPSSNY